MLDNKLNNSDPMFEIDDCLKLNIRTSYTPSLTTELERLFLVPSTIPQGSIWSDFSSNGVDAELDEIDQLGIRIRRADAEYISDSCSTGSSVDGAQMDVNPVPPMSRGRLLDILRMSERGRLKAKAPGSRQTKQTVSNSTQVCVFCRNNGESEQVYNSHTLKDGYGKTACPVLYIYTCPICGANGPDAHTIKYCPQNNHATLSPMVTVPVVEAKPQPKPARLNKKYQQQHQQQRYNGHILPSMPTHNSLSSYVN